MLLLLLLLMMTMMMILVVVVVVVVVMLLMVVMVVPPPAGPHTPCWPSPPPHPNVCIGRLPLIWLLLTSNMVRSGRASTPGGIGPLRLLPSMLKKLR